FEDLSYWAVGCNGLAFACYDTSGNIWLTGGEDADPHLSSPESIEVISYICSNTDTSIVISNPYCGTICIDSIWIEGNTFVTLNSQRGIKCLESNEKDTIFFRTSIDTAGAATKNTARL